MSQTLRLDKEREIIVLTLRYSLIYFSSKLYSQCKDEVGSTTHYINRLINCILSFYHVIHYENKH